LKDSDKLEEVRCDVCDCIVAQRRRDGAIVIRSRHWGEVHITILEPPTAEPLQPAVERDTMTSPE